MLYRFIKGFFRILMAVIMPVKVVGKENFISGKCIITCNHQTFLDIPCLIAHCPNEIYFMAKSSLFEKSKLLSYLFKKMHAFPVKTQSADITSLRHAVGVLKEGKTLGIFPQGTRIKQSPYIDRNQVFSGPAFIALKAKADIVPCMLERAPVIFRRNTLYVGKPIRISDLPADMSAQEKTEKLTDIITEAMNSLLKNKGKG